jgi:outer membrane protein OmpA-like peptidoglycan-associated protein
MFTELAPILFNHGAVTTIIEIIMENITKSITENLPMKRPAHGIMLALLSFILSVLSICIVTAVVLVCPLHAQLRVGIAGGVAANQHSAAFAEFRDAPFFAPRTEKNWGNNNFASGTGFGFSLSALGEMPFATNLAVALRATFSTHDALLRAFEPTATAGNAATAIEYQLRTTLRSLTAEPMLQWSPFQSSQSERGGFRVYAGLRAGVWMGAPSFAATERLSADAQGSFSPTDPTQQERPLQAGSVPRAQAFQCWAVGGLGYDIPLGNTPFVIAPEVSYSFAFTNVAANLPTLTPQGLAEGGSWNAHQIRAGIALKYVFQTQRPASEEPPPTKADAPLATTPRTPPKKSLLIPQLRATAIGSDGTPSNELVVRSASRSTQSFCPLLPYIFFDNEANAIIPDRYALLTPRQVAAFDPAALQDGETLQPHEHVYYHLLNIVAERMKRFPNAKLTLTGCVDGASLGENGRADIARARAEAVRRYLTNAWGIAASRVLVAVQQDGLSLKPSRPLEERAKMQENRRVELATDTPELLDPVLLEDQSRSVTASSLRLTPLVQKENALGQVARWRVAVRQNGELAKEWNGIGEPPARLDWAVGDTPADALNLIDAFKGAQKPLEMQLTVWDANGVAATSPVQTLSVRRDESAEAASKQVPTFARYRLIFYDVDRFDLNRTDATKSSFFANSTRTLDLIRQMLGQTLTPRSLVRFAGFTDRTGNEDANRRLSFAYARATADALGLKNASAVGNGSTPLLYDNALAEGRMYCRTVLITVENP